MFARALLASLLIGCNPQPLDLDKDPVVETGDSDTAGSDTGADDVAFTLRGDATLPQGTPAVDNVVAGLLFADPNALGNITAVWRSVRLGRLEPGETVDVRLGVPAEIPEEFQVLNPGEADDGLAGGAFVLAVWTDPDQDGLFDEGDTLLGAVDGLMLYLFAPVPDTLGAVGALPGWNVSRFSGYPSVDQTALPLEDDLSALDIKIDMVPSEPPLLKAVLGPDPGVATVAVDVFHLGATVGLSAPQQPTYRQATVQPAGTNSPVRFAPPWPAPPPEHLSVLAQEVPLDFDTVARDGAASAELNVAIYELRAYLDANDSGSWTDGEVVYGESFVTGAEPMVLYATARAIGDIFLIRRLGLPIGWSLASLEEGVLTPQPWTDGIRVDANP